MCRSRSCASSTTLGALVCAAHPDEVLGFRAQAHCYVDVPQEVARDTQDFVGGVLQLMESSLGYLLRNTQVGISARQGGMSVPEYPEDLLRETVNNARAHRDYGLKFFALEQPNEFLKVVALCGRRRRRLTRDGGDFSKSPCFRRSRPMCGLDIHDQDLNSHPIQPIATISLFVPATSPPIRNSELAFGPACGVLALRRVASRPRGRARSCSGARRVRSRAAS